MYINCSEATFFSIGLCIHVLFGKGDVAPWVIGSILHGVDPLSYFSFQPVLHDWYNKDAILSVMVHIQEPLLLIGNSSLCGGSVFPLLLSEWSFTICPTPYN